MSNIVNHPNHYNSGKIEVIEIIEDQLLGFHLGNAVKYICRSGKKDPKKYVEDLKKAVWYINREIELQKANPRRPNEMNERNKMAHNGSKFKSKRTSSVDRKVKKRGSNIKKKKKRGK